MTYRAARNAPVSRFHIKEERVFNGLHGRGVVMFVLAQEQEVLADLILGEDRRITLEVFGQFADVADVLLFGGWPIIF